MLKRLDKSTAVREGVEAVQGKTRQWLQSFKWFLPPELEQCTKTI